MKTDLALIVLNYYNQNLPGGKIFLKQLLGLGGQETFFIFTSISFISLSSFWVAKSFFSRVDIFFVLLFIFAFN